MTRRSGEIPEQGLTLVDAETLYFICIGEPVHEGIASDGSGTEEKLAERHRPRQLAFKF